MKKVIVFLGALAATASAARSANADDAAMLQQLLQENQNLTVQFDKAHKVEGDIGKAKLAIDGADAALKHAQEQLQRKGNGLIQEQQDIHSQADATGCPWGTLNSNEAYVTSCNAEGARLSAMLQDVQKRGVSLQVYAQQLQKERTELSQRTLDWFAKKKSNNADLELLEQARTQWHERYNNFVFHSETYERLKVTAPGAKMCEQIAPDDLPGAAACLHRLWDGSQ